MDAPGGAGPAVTRALARGGDWRRAVLLVAIVIGVAIGVDALPPSPRASAACLQAPDGLPGCVARHVVPSAITTIVLAISVCAALTALLLYRLPALLTGPDRRRGFRDGHRLSPEFLAWLSSQADPAPVRTPVRSEHDAVEPPVPAAGRAP